MDHNAILSRLSLGLEALDAIGERAKIERDRAGIFIGSWRGDNYACFTGKTVEEALDGLEARHAQKSSEAADRAAFEAWRAEHGKAAA